MKKKPNHRTIEVFKIRDAFIFATNTLDKMMENGRNGVEFREGIVVACHTIRLELLRNDCGLLLPDVSPLVMTGSAHRYLEKTQRKAAKRQKGKRNES